MTTDAEVAAARYLQGRADEQAGWVAAVREMVAYSEGIVAHRPTAARYHAARAAALDALLRRMGVE